MTKSLIVLGAGGHAKVVISTARTLGYTIETVYDDDSTKWGASLMGAPIRGGFQQLEQRSEPVVWSVIAVGDNRTRQRIAAQLHHLRWTTLIHPHSWIDPTAEVGVGTLVCAGVVVQPDARIGRHCIINTAASIDHDCTLADFVHVAPGARLAGGVKVEEGALLGVGCCILPSVQIGAWSVVGAGAVVTEDVPDGVIVVGVPARVIRRIDND